MYTIMHSISQDVVNTITAPENYEWNELSVKVATSVPSPESISKIKHNSFQ